MKDIIKKIKAYTEMDFKKVVAYFFIGFITFLLVLFFIGSDIIRSCGGGSLDQNAIALVDGKNIHRLDFYRYRDMIVRSNRNQKFEEKQILDQYIAKYLFYRRATELGFEASDDKVTKFIKDTYREDRTKSFDPERFKDFLKANHYSFSEFFKKSKQDVIENQFQKLIKMGFAVHPSDVMAEYIISNSVFQIQFAFLSNDDLKARLKNEIAVSDFEVMNAVNPDKGNTDTDKNIAREKLELKKLEKAASKLIDKINKMAQNGKSFNEAAAYLGGKVAVSGKFKFGEKVTDQAGKPIPSLYNRAFFENCLATKPGRTSSIIDTREGLFIISPTYFEMAKGEPTPEEYRKIEENIRMSGFVTVYENMINELFTQSKIIKNLKTN